MVESTPPVAPEGEGPPPGMPPGPPPGPVFVDLPVEKTWLQEKINQKEDTHGIIKETKNEMIGIGKGFLSDVIRVTITWDEASKDLEKLPGGVVLKVPTLEKVKQLGPMADMFNEDVVRQVHNQECDTYTYFTKYQPPPFPMATCYYLEKREGDQKGMIILRDLTDDAKSFGFNDDATIEHIKTMARNIGSLQAYCFNHPEYREYFSQVPTNFMEPMMMQVLPGAAYLREHHPDRFSHTDEKIQMLIDYVKNNEIFFRDPSDAGFTPVVSLGDVQPNNILWKRGPNDEITPEVSAYIDFQVAHVGNCIGDLSMTMMMQLPLESRTDDHIKEFFQLQLDTLKANAKCEVPITLDEMLKLADIMSMQGCVFSIAQSQMMMQMGPALGITPERADIMFERSMDGIQKGMALFDAKLAAEEKEQTKL